MMNVTTKQGKQAMVTVDKGAQTAHVTVEGVKYLVAFIRDGTVMFNMDFRSLIYDILSHDPLTSVWAMMMYPSLHYR